jgi:hypothetical protein
MGEELPPELVAQAEAALVEAVRPPTPEEIARVRRHDCLSYGHTWTATFELGREDPVSIFCPRCGRTCAVGPGA